MKVTWLVKRALYSYLQKNTRWRKLHTLYSQRRVKATSMKEAALLAPEVGTWTPLALAGLYILVWERSNRTRWKYRDTSLELLIKIEGLVAKVGTRAIKKGIEQSTLKIQLGEQL